MKKFLIALTLVGALTMAAACSSGGTGTTGSTDAPAAEEQQQEGPVTANVGDTVELDGYKITISNQRTEKPEYATDEYLLFDVEIENTNDKAGSFFGEFQGVTADGMVVDDTFALGVDGDPVMTAFSKNLSQGQKAKGYLAFKTADGITQIEILPGIGGDKDNDKIIINVQ